jgi:hypothetical protein
MSKIKKLLVVGGLALFGVLLVVFGVQEYRTSKKLQAEGKQTLGVVSDATVQRGRKGRRSYYLTVLFKDEAQKTFEQREKVSRSVYDEASKAGSVQVTYLPGDPAVCAFGPKVDTKWGMILFGILMMGSAGVSAFSKSQEGHTGSASEATAEKELLAGPSRDDGRQKAA